MSQTYFLFLLYFFLCSFAFAIRKSRSADLHSAHKASKKYRFSGFVFILLLLGPFSLLAQNLDTDTLFPPKPHFFRITGKPQSLPPAMAQSPDYIDACSCLQLAMGAPLFDLNILLPTYQKSPKLPQWLGEEYPPLASLEIYSLKENPWTETEKEIIQTIYPQTQLTFKELGTKNLNVAQYYHFFPNPDLGQLANHHEASFTQNKKQYGYLKSVERENRAKEMVLLDDPYHYRAIWAISTSRPGLTPECQTQFWTLEEGKWQEVSEEILLQINRELSLNSKRFFFSFSEGVGDAELYHLNNEGKLGEKIGNARWDRGRFWLKR